MIIMMIFNMSTSYSHKFSFHYFVDYLMAKLTRMPDMTPIFYIASKKKKIL
jgi:hypothetical protein